MPSCGFLTFWCEAHGGTSGGTSGASFCLDTLQVVGDRSCDMSAERPRDVLRSDTVREDAIMKLLFSAVGDEKNFWNLKARR